MQNLLRAIVAHYNREELKTLCFSLGINYDELGGEVLSAKARELLAYLDRRGRIPDLIATGKRLRPDVAWDDALAAWAQAKLDADMERLRVKLDQADQARRELRQRQRVVNLRPLDVTHTFRDRRREMPTLCDHLADGSVRLVSILGRGGMGKTALASYVLADLEQGVLPAPDEQKKRPIDGILYLSARGTGISLERIYADVGRMLGEPAASQLAARWANRDTPLVAKVEYLLEHLQDGLYLILLDNLEDELAEDGIIREEGLRLFFQHCLTQPGGAQLIVTSRAQVKIAAAALRNARTIPLREGLPEDESIALLRDLDPDGALGLREAPEADLRQAAQLTQGIPRALEILAGILHEDPTTSLPQLLGDEDLFGEQVVEQLVAQGHRSLGENERRVMEALAVFDRPAEETAVAYLLHPWFPGMDVRVSLRRLARGYFVSVNRITGEYSLHPLYREYAYRQLPDDGGRLVLSNAEGPVSSPVEGPDVYNRRNLELRAADFYASIRKPESEWKSIEDLAPQLNEFEHRVRGGDYDGAFRVLELIDNEYLFLWGHYARLIELREKLLGRLLNQAQVINLNNLGLAYSVLRQVDKAIELYTEALATAREIGDRKWEGSILCNLGYARYFQGQIEQAVELFDESLNVAREIKDRRSEAIRLSSLGEAYRDLGQAERAIDFVKEALAITREIGSRRWECDSLGALGHINHGLGRIEQAISLYQEALAIAHEICDHQQESYCLPKLSRALVVRGELAQAQKHCMEALRLDIPDSYQAALVLGIVLLHQDDATAGNAFEDACVRCESMLQNTPDLCEPRYILATALVGLAICNPRWSDESQRAQLLAPALAEYRRALEITAAFGIVGDALRDLKLIRAAGVEGLEPVFELLESV